uniref:Nucleolar protein 8 n=1 Tax=Caenorhabditis japonica TaxID=281687 RepID=A0A8R1HLE2_CAEJA
MPPEQDSEEQRRQRSEEARRAAMRLKIEQKKAQERQIAADIANVDKKGTKRIVFEDSDEEGEEVAEEKATSSSSSTVQASSKPRGPKLFDSEDEKDDEDDVINEDFMKNRHSGPKGEKLMKLESRFNSDPRFKLDDKFAESDSDDDGGNAEGSAEKAEMKQEKDKHRELLSRILGKTVEEKKPKTSSETLLKARPFTRFDPENPEHLEWMKAFEAAKNPKKTPVVAESSGKSDGDDSEGEGVEKEKDEEEEEKEEKSDDEFEKAEIFFKMDEQFAVEMKERKEEPTGAAGFSFLSSIGRKYEEPPENDEEEEAEIPEEPEKVEAPTPTPTPQVTLKSGKPIISAFFVDPFVDEKIKSMAANFRRTQTVEKVIDKWAPHRDAIFKLWKKQRRDAVKKQKDSFFTNGKQQRKRKIEEEENAEKPAA